jgi:hypothetical protein
MWQAARAFTAAVCARSAIAPQHVIRGEKDLLPPFIAHLQGGFKGDDECLSPIAALEPEFSLLAPAEPSDQA